RAGQLALVGALEDAVRVGAADLEGVARANLAAWEARTAELQRKYGFVRPTGWVWAVALSPDGKMLLTANTSDGAGLWDVASGRRLAVLEPPQEVWGVAWSPDGTELLTATGTLPEGAGAVQRWDAVRRQPVGDPLLHPGRVWKVAFQPPSGRSFLSVCGK